MKYTVTGADKRSGQDTNLTLAAATAEEAERLAVEKGILVASIRPETTDDDGPIALWDEAPGTPAAAAPALPTNLLGNGPSASAAPPVQATPAVSGQYHVIQNPSLYLLESAVNKHIKDGWEPLGGVQVNNWNNQLQFFQALMRRGGGN